MITPQSASAGTLGTCILGKSPEILAVSSTVLTANFKYGLFTICSSRVPMMIAIIAAGSTLTYLLLTLGKKWMMLIVMKM